MGTPRLVKRHQLHRLHTLSAAGLTGPLPPRTTISSAIGPSPTLTVSTKSADRHATAPDNNEDEAGHLRAYQQRRETKHDQYATAPDQLESRRPRHSQHPTTLSLALMVGSGERQLPQTPGVCGTRADLPSSQDFAPTLPAKTWAREQRARRDVAGWNPLPHLDRDSAAAACCRAGPILWVHGASGQSARPDRSPDGSG